jgi:hypothetical protein
MTTVKSFPAVVIALLDIRSWPKADLPRRLLFGRCRAQSGLYLLALRISACDPRRTKLLTQKTLGHSTLSYLFP